MSENREKKVVKASNVARGTILFSHCQYNGIMVEYRLNQYKKEFYDLLLYPKIINTSQDYNIGLTIKSKSNLINAVQKSLVYGRVVKHTPQILSKEQSTDKTRVILCNGVRKILHGGEDCTRVGAFKFKFRVKELEDLDLWITLHGNYKDYELIKIPNLINYHPPLKKYNIYQAYPFFRPKLKKGDKKWWLAPQIHYVQEVQNPIVNWNDIYLEVDEELGSHQILELIRKIIYQQFRDQDRQSESDSDCEIPKINSLALGLKNLKLETLGDNHYFRIDNVGPELKIYVQDSLGSQIVDVPTGATAFDFLVEGYDICVKLFDQYGPVLFEQHLDRLNADIYFVEQLSGFWIYITNNYPYDIQTKIEFFCDDISNSVQEDVISQIPGGTKQRKWFNHPFGQLNYKIKIYLLNDGKEHIDKDTNYSGSSHGSRSNSGNGDATKLLLLSQKDVRPREDNISNNPTFLGNIKPQALATIKKKKDPTSPILDKNDGSIKLELNRNNIDLIQKHKDLRSSTPGLILDIDNNTDNDQNEINTTDISKEVAEVDMKSCQETEGDHQSAEEMKEGHQAGEEMKEDDDQSGEEMKEGHQAGEEMKEGHQAGEEMKVGKQSGEEMKEEMREETRQSHTINEDTMIEISNTKKDVDSRTKVESVVPKLELKPKIMVQPKLKKQHLKIKPKKQPVEKPKLALSLQLK